MKLSTTLIATCLGTGLFLVVNLDQAQAGGRVGNRGNVSINLSHGNPQLSIGNGSLKIQSHPVQQIRRRHVDCYYGFEFAPSYTYYCNPYVVVPVEGVAVEAIAIDPSAQGETEQGMQFLAAAREAFLAHNINAAMSNVGHALVEMPNNPNAHQFKSLVLFAVGKFRESASSAHVALTSGRGWNWPTLRSFYVSGNEYTSQLRRLEITAKTNPSDASSRFLLGYHYMMMGQIPSAMIELQNVVQLEPRDQLAAQMLKMVAANAGVGVVRSVGQPVQSGQLGQPGQPGQPVQPGQPALQTAPIESTVQESEANVEPAAPASINNPTRPTTPVETAPAPGQLGAAEGNVEGPQLNPPVGPATTAAQIGTFKASPAEGVEIRTELRADGTFTWKVDAKGQKKEFSGKFTIENNTLTLARENDGQKMVGTLTPIDQNSFNFKLQSAKEKDTGLNFARI